MMSPTMNREQQAEQNRKRFPLFTAWLDGLRAFDPEARVLWVVEDGKTAGRVPPEEIARCST